MPAGAASRSRERVERAAVARAAGTSRVADAVAELPPPTAGRDRWRSAAGIPAGGSSAADALTRVYPPPRYGTGRRSEHVTKRFGDVVAVDDLTLEVADHEFLVLLGPSGCGKSTALRMIAGLEELDRGHDPIGDRVVNDVEPKDRDIAMVFQSYALYPHMTVRKNIEFPLRSRKVEPTERDALVARGGRGPRARRAARPQARAALRRASASGSRSPGRSCAGRRRS